MKLVVFFLGLCAIFGLLMGVVVIQRATATRSETCYMDHHEAWSLGDSAIIHASVHGATSEQLAALAFSITDKCEHEGAVYALTDIQNEVIEDAKEKAYIAAHPIPQIITTPIASERTK